MARAVSNQILCQKISNRNIDDSALFIDGESPNVSEVVLMTIETITGVTCGTISPTTILMGTGYDSIASLVLVAKLKHQYQSLVLSVNDVFRLDTVGDLINLIKDRLDGSAKSGGVIVSN
uniref:Carrier domain-containing protein n=1 Tax=Leptocylindrus danicus TaxID=163516 RepID=A0A7S2P9J7_9STRA|mmetsp:Transcript_25510/g.38080  ORF Transcript_25510/g.38080 Transcript_25510/m.38080 type:complete len:120 (+) Transcript_25510:2-361(+)